jgi:hypothetical protein
MRTVLASVFCQINGIFIQDYVQYEINENWDLSYALNAYKIAFIAKVIEMRTQNGQLFGVHFDENGDFIAVT